MNTDRHNPPSGPQPQREPRWPNGTPRLEGVACPMSGEFCDSHVPAPGTDPGAYPTAGAVLVCAYCATPSMLDGGAGLGLAARPLTPTERADLDGEAGFAEALALARADARLWRAAARMRATDHARQARARQARTGSGRASGPGASGGSPGGQL